MSFADDPDHRLAFENEDVVAKYEAARYTSRGQSLIDRRELACLQGLIERSGAERGQAVLDMPCGYGRIAPVLVRAGLKPLWADLALAMAGRVAKRPEAKHGLGQFVGNAGKIPLADNSVDGATCIRLLQHFRSTQGRTAVLTELGRVVRNWAIVSFYDSGSVHSWTKGIACKLQGKPMRIEMQSRATFAAEAQAAGLKMIEFSAPARYVHAHTYALMAPH